VLSGSSLTYVNQPLAAGFNLGLAIDSNLGDLAVIAPKLERLLLTVGRLAAHLDPTDRAPARGDDDPLDLGLPSAMADPDMLGDAQARPG
jgi:hypothetical protein